MKQLQLPRRRAQAGFTLIEALVALLVMSFGMLALAGMQISMTRGSDVAKQRSEAVRLAQLKMEDLRSYDGLTSGTFTYNANVVSNTAGETICPSPTCSAPLDSATNTTFTRRWFVTDSTGAASAPANAAQKWIRVLVTWTDRAGQTQSVTLNSVIASNDPIALKGLIGGQARAKTRYPKNRQVNIPYPAVTLSGGNTSAFIPPPGNLIYVFNNDTGNVIQSCSATAYSITAITRVGTTATVLAAGHPFVNGNRVTISGATPGGYNGDVTVSGVVTGVSFTYTVASSLAITATLSSATVRRLVTLVDGLDLATLSPSVTCTSANAYLLSGFVRFRISGGAATAANLSAVNSEGLYDTPLLLSTAGPLTIDSSATGNGPQSYTCFAQSQDVIEAANQSPVNITSTARSGNVVTVNTSGSHGYAVGQRVSIAEVSDFKFNGSFNVESVPTSTSFTYVQEEANASATSGRAALIQRLTVATGVTVTGYNTLLTKFISYTCVVTPDPSLTGADAGSWWGEAKLVTNGSWAFGTTASTYKVCRASGDFANDAQISNHEHPRYYRRVKPSTDGSGTLDGQNFLVIKGNENCPTDIAADPVNGDFINTGTVTHQTVTSGADTGAELSFKCTNAACNGANKVTIEPASVTAPVPMF